MKKTLFIIPVIALAMIACGGGGETGGEDAAAEETTEEAGDAALTGAATDLSEYGMNYTIVLPQKNNVQTVITETDWGGVEVQAGEMFWLTIAYGEGDIDLLKFDLEEDLMYKSEILEESENHLLYKREIENSGMDPEFHFMYVLRLEGDAIEVQNSKDASFNEEAIRAMLASAKSMAEKGGA